MGQGYKHDNLDAAPENIKKMARISSGYNEARAELHELEHELSYCTITAPISGYVIKIQNTLYGMANIGMEPFSPSLPLHSPQSSILLRFQPSVRLMTMVWYTWKPR